jgi:hypothetical protein
MVFVTGCIETHASLDGFFSDLLVDALTAEGVVLNDACKTYLLRLCGEFARHEALHGCETPGELGTPALVWLYERAQKGDRGLRFQAYRQLGDISLVVSGFFSAHIERERSLVGVDYYVQMGATAYENAASLAGPLGFKSLLRELSTKFRRLVEVLSHVAEQTTLPVARDVAALYERLCLNPESSDLQRRLVTQGLIPAVAVAGGRN